MSVAKCECCSPVAGDPQSRSTKLVDQKLRESRPSLDPRPKLPKCTSSGSGTASQHTENQRSGHLHLRRCFHPTKRSAGTTFDHSHDTAWLDSFFIRGSAGTESHRT